jgi:Spherulation-specific family 4
VNPHAADGTDLIMPTLLVPAYFHPAVCPDDWAWLADHAAQVRMIVLNPASGPGLEPDGAFFPVLERLISAGVVVTAYVDTNYGHRAAQHVVTDFARYVDWYPVSGVFFDRVPTGANQLDHYADLSRRVRAMGAHVVAFNHGAHPVEAYAEHADLLGTFEGPWNVYYELAVPRWVRSWPAGRFFHLVHTAPTSCFSDAIWLTARRNAGCVYITDRSGANPWDGLPARELDLQSLWTLVGTDRDGPGRL